MKAVFRLVVGIGITYLAAVSYADALLDQLGEPGQWGSHSFDIASGNACLGADDFTPPLDSTIEEFKCQYIYLEGGSGSTTGFILRIYLEDFLDDPVWEVSISLEDMDIIPTGDDWGSWQVYQAEIELDPSDYFDTDAGTTYWFAWQIQNEYDCRNLEVNVDDPNGSRAWQYYQGEWQEIADNADAACYLGGSQEGEVADVSWGQIKATF